VGKKLNPDGTFAYGTFETAKGENLDPPKCIAESPLEAPMYIIGAIGHDFSNVVIYISMVPKSTDELSRESVFSLLTGAVSKKQ